MPSRRAYGIGPVDIALAVACIPPTIGGALASDGGFRPVHVAIIAVTVVLILLRRRAPIPMLLAGAVALVASVTITERPNGLFPALIVLVFTVAVRSDRRTGISAGAVGMVAFVTVILILGAHGLLGPQVLAAVAWPALAAAAGDVIRSRRAALAAAEERARRAEETREEEARRRVAEERLHIARELHDVVAHRMAVVNVQAGVAEHLLRSQPDAAADALRVVRASARSALDELGGILNVLRDVDGLAPVEPAPTLTELGALVDSFRDAGLEVEWETTGAPRSVSTAAQLAVYRTVQEALTNAHKHGDGRARLTVRHADDGIDIEVVNAVGTAAAASTANGHGLIGMRERVAATGGTLSAAPDASGRFHVVAHIPAHPEHGAQVAP